MGYWLSDKCFNPFDTGQGLSTRELFLTKTCKGVSIPLIQGKVFRLYLFSKPKNYHGFNPFDTGQGLSTVIRELFLTKTCFNPFDTGQGLSTDEMYVALGVVEFQSL